MIDIIFVGEFVVVEGKSQKGKNRVQEHGQVWKVRNVRDNGHILLESTDGKDNWRWVWTNDPDFDLIRIVSDLDNL